MTDSPPVPDDEPERAFLDANVIRGQLTNDILLSLAENDVLNPRWSQTVLDEMRRNRPAGVTEQRIDRRIAMMNTFFSRAMTSGHERLIREMQADEKDKHVLAAAVHSHSAVLVTDNVKDFDPPATGPFAMRVERVREFLTRKLQEMPERVVPALESMVGRNRLEPRSIPALIDKMAAMPELREFAQALNERVAPEHRGSHEALKSPDQISTQASAAFDGIADADGAVANPPQKSPAGT